ncbi:heavy metal transporter [Streptomyces camelliae]|uniref:Heavy metal transporter n=1 Tax=Streptomyces camelliae TaxID=3004093 RepID=A0ABY7PC48_9ACTN|nr:heavy metal transporter [Streptomyces sp. HUAS 2-6]WBO67142.1 heavy metal transporter [Streptomyces sp. HUAS 2-6]
MAAASRRGRRRLWPVVIGVGVVLALVGYLAVRFIRSATSDACTAHGTDGTTVTLDLDQASHAATIAAVAHARGLPERAVTIALATAIQESKLRDLSYGDRDSLGLFQQRPSEGWGSPAQIRDPVYASGKFFDALVKVPDYVDLPVTVAAQDVQHSGYPEAYASHEATAATLADVLTGQEGPALTCTISGASKSGADAAQAGGGSGTDDAGAGRGGGTAGVVHEGGDGGGVAAAVRREFGRVPAAVPATGSSVSYPVTETATGWSLALWLVCHADALHAASVTFDNRRWSSGASDHGWTQISPASANSSTVAVNVSRPAVAAAP